MEYITLLASKLYNCEYWIDSMIWTGLNLYFSPYVLSTMFNDEIDSFVNMTSLYGARSGI